MIRRAFDTLRRLRLRAKLARHLLNSSEVWRAYSSGLPPPVLRLRNGATVVHGPQDAPVMLLLEIIANGCYRTRIDLDDGLVVDVGANIGLFVLDCAFRYPRVRFHAYEPDPQTFQTLQLNVERNGLRDRVSTYNEAVGASCGEVLLAHGEGSVMTRTVPVGSADAGAVKVPMVDLQIVVARAAGRIQALKIDAEGAEVDAFEGADDDALAAIDQIVGEYHEWLVPGSIERLKRRFAAARFSFHLVRAPQYQGLFTARRPGSR